MAKKQNYKLCLNCDNKLEITKVIEIVEFDSNKFYLATRHGPITITGNDLMLSRYDELNQEITINGIVESISYESKEDKQ